MNENYNNCGSVCVEPKGPTIQQLAGETLERLTRLNEQLSAICATLYGSPIGDLKNSEAKCLNDVLVLLLDKATVANDQAFRIMDGLS